MNNGSIGRQSFRDLINDIVEVEDQKRMLAHDNSSKSENTVFNSLSDKAYSIIKRISLLMFFVELITYTIERIRVIGIISIVIVEIIGDYIDLFKKWVIRKMFWGRGSWFSHSMRFVGLVILLVVLVTREYRSEVIEYQQGYLNPVLADSTIVGDDLLIQNATTITQIPKDRGRLGITEYTVKSGDTIGGIANYYQISEETIRWANNLSDGHVISPGQVLRIPPGNGVIKPVEDGDTLETFAARWGGNAQTVADVNWIDPPFELEVGKELFVPDGRVPDPPKVVTYASSAYWQSSVTPSGDAFLSWPVENCRGIVTQWPSSWHNAIDIADGSGPTLVAAADGTVMFAGCHSGSCPALVPGGFAVGGYLEAWAVEIDHGNGFMTMYGHMNAIYVTSGQYVTRGTPIGQMGMSGTATGIHVHFELWQGRKWNRVTPTWYMYPGTCGWI